MANVLSSNPMVLDTDFNSYQAVQTLTAQSELLGLRIRKISLYAGTTTVAGQISVVDAVTGNPLLAPMNVGAGNAAGTVLYFDSFDHSPMWTDFKVTGLTATGAKLLIWYGR